MRFQRESLGEAASDILNFSNDHYKEISKFLDIALDPDFDKYAKLEKLQSLLVFTARQDSGELIGYATFIIGHHIHYKNSKQASQDLLFFARPYRGYSVSFIPFCDEQLKQAGIDVVRHSVSTRNDFSKLLIRNGYQLDEFIYSRRLK